ncbi:MAG: ATP-binding protein [Hyphomonadaceae bacterium]|nr:ATP-binding protein [Hyphomonadaceae bacterium]
MAGALLIASMVNFALLVGERQRAGINEQNGPSIARFVDVASEIFAAPPPDRLAPFLVERRRGPGRYNVSAENPVDGRNLRRDQGLEQRLLRNLREANITVTEVRAASRVVSRAERSRQGGVFIGIDGRPIRLRDFGPGGPPPGGRPPDGPPPDGPPPDGPRPDGPPGPPRDGMMREVFAGDDIEMREIVLAARLPDGRWLNGLAASPLPPTGELWRLGATTFITFAFVLAAALWIASRLSRPLNDLTRAAARVGSAAAEPEEVAVRGPGDVRQTLEAFNAMSRRVSQLLGEKDVMLGALGHDLRTPLSSLRIRIETMEPESERVKAVKTIEEASQLLEDILELARRGRSSEPVQAIDLSILVEDMVEDYAETGAPVSLSTSEKAPAAVRQVLFRRALRNLIDNAITYGQTARLSVRREGSDVLVRIEDDGPGMSEKSLASAGQPFVRGDASRNRSTGGAGLGLTLADAIAKAHGGSLTLENRTPGGFAAIIRLPAAVVSA